MILLLVLAVRVHFLDVPLERDEGEYAYLGQSILKGIPPYSQAYNMKFPGTYLAYAFLMLLFGKTVSGIHFGFIVINCVTIILIFLTSKKLSGGPAPIVSAGAYAVLSITPGVFGFAAHATHFVVLFAAGGALLLLEAEERKKLSWYLLAGIVTGIAMIMKQHGALFIIFGAAYMIATQLQHERKELALRLALYACGSSLPFLVTVAWLSSAGVFSAFWFWTVDYAAQYASQLSPADAFGVFSSNLSRVVRGFIPVWILAALGVVALFSPETKTNRKFVLLFLLFSFFSICPGFYFRRHYFVTLLPAVSMLIGIFVDFLHMRFSANQRLPFLKHLGIALFVVSVLAGMLGYRNYFFLYKPDELSRAVYSANPFPEAERIAAYIKARTLPAEKIAVFGSEPEIFFYADRTSASGFIYMYELMEIHPYVLAMQKKMIQEIEAAQPKYVTLVNIPLSWHRIQDSQTYILHWIDDYLQAKYTLVGIADIISMNQTEYRWDQEIKGYEIKSKYNVLVYEKNQ